MTSWHHPESVTEINLKKITITFAQKILHNGQHKTPLRPKLASLQWLGHFLAYLRNCI
jgi:hypothetical protein